jgi:5-methyltetrahydropteroyltriglutamate--homocysteine methyltransferase
MMTREHMDYVSVVGICCTAVIDVTTNYLEHPEVVADGICQWVDAVGDRERVIACTDYGFGTFAAFAFVAEDVVWAKLQALSEG